MTPTLTLQFASPLPPTTGAVDALAQVTAGADFLQALQQWLAQLQPPAGTVPSLEPAAGGTDLPPSRQGPALLASLLASRKAGGAEDGSASGEEAAPFTPETAEDALALLRQLLLEAGDTPAPGIGEAVACATRRGAGSGEELPPGGELPPNALATLSALSRQLEHWLQRARGEAAAEGESAGQTAEVAEQLAVSPQTAAETVSASAVLPVAAPIPAENAPAGEAEAATPPPSVAADRVASLVRKTERETLPGLSAEKGASPRAAAVPDVPLSRGRGPEAPSPSAGASVPAPAASDTAVPMAPAAVPPAPVSQAFSAVLDDLMPPAADSPAPLPDTASPIAAQAVASNPPGPAPDRSASPPVATPVGHPGWDTEMSQRVVWMAGNSVSSAEIHLNPPHLGPVEVRISLNPDQQTTTIQFLSPHAAVREALEAALPKLRDQFGAQQLNLGDVSVSQQSAGQQQDNPQARGFQFQQQQQSSPWRGAQPEFPLADGALPAEEGERLRPVRVGQGLLNLYA